MLFDLKNQTKVKLPKVPWSKVATAVLGNKYELSLVFALPKTSQALNKKYRRKSYVPNVLAFPLGPKNGEIFITPAVVERSDFLYLFIHGLLHLKGLAHGSTMERKERSLLKRFSARHEKNNRRS